MSRHCDEGAVEPAGVPVVASRLAVDRGGRETSGGTDAAMFQVATTAIVPRGPQWRVTLGPLPGMSLAGGARGAVPTQCTCRSRPAQ
jgi:hypothetical protein